MSSVSAGKGFAWPVFSPRDSERTERDFFSNVGFDTLPFVADFF